MFKRNLVLGGLLAGAFLLPSLAVAAGSVNGPCVNCHTMHNSQGGVARATTIYGNLLMGSGCTGCHAVPTLANDNTGRATAGAKAPQVDYDSIAGYINNGGYFNTGTTAADDARQHNMAAISQADGALGIVPPGGTLFIPPTKVGFTCENCHSAKGHHADATAKYRMLEGSNYSFGLSGAAKYGPLDKTAVTLQGNVIAAGARSNVTYNATDMNKLCAKCHATFHAPSGSSMAWLRHPVDVAVSTTTTRLGILTRSANADSNEVPVGSNVAGTATATATDRTVMCISCHVPHGGPYADLLAFNYGALASVNTANNAGDGNIDEGCESCHGYGTGM